MKIRFLLLPFILVSIIISGSINAQSELFINKNQGHLFETVFSPHEKFLNHGVSEEHNFSHTKPYHRLQLYPFHPFSGRHSHGLESPHNIRNATYLLDRNVEKAERISAQLDTRIQQYRAEGKDVSRLESSLEKYKLLIQEAKEYLARANSSAEEENNRLVINLVKNSPENSERLYLIKSQKKMIEASHTLKDIFREFRQLMPGSEELNSTSSLNATGKGRAFLKGNFILNLHVEKGEMAIPYLSPDSEINIKGDYIVEKKNKMRNEMQVYHIQSADVKISGSDKTVMLKGESINLSADGEGSLTFVGKGAYRIENTGRVTKEQSWEPPFFEEGMHPDKFRHDRINSSEFIPPNDRLNPDEFKPGDGINPDKFDISNDEINPDKINPFKNDINSN
jgi:hypothetical protein